MADNSSLGRFHTILQVNTNDIEGGAAKVAWDLFKGFQSRGYKCWLAVGEKRSKDPAVLEIPHFYPFYLPWAGLTWALRKKLKPYDGRIRGVNRFRKWLNTLSDVWGEVERQMGREDFNYRGSWDLLKLPPEPPEIVNAHNLHEFFFDLRSLPSLSLHAPLVLTLQDAWLLSGHCAHSFDCDRWKIGCGDCPDLTIPPAVKRDATAYNWELKRRIFSQSRIFVITPSKWLMEKIQQSMLAPGIIRSKVIPNGINLQLFHPEDKNIARDKLGISRTAKVLVFVARDLRINRFKDYETLRKAVSIVSERLSGQEIRFFALGGDNLPKKPYDGPIEFIGFNPDHSWVSHYYQAADAYIHSALVDTFPNTVLEAMACGTPVVATGVGGIPEQVQDGLTGFLVQKRNPEEMAEKIIFLLKEDNMRNRMGKEAAEIARLRFDLNRQLDLTLAFYEEAMSQWKAEVSR